MNLWMESLDSTVQHFGKARVITEVDNLKAGLAKGLGGSSRRNQFHSGGRKRAGQRFETGLIENREKGALNFFHNRALTSSKVGVRVNRQSNKSCRAGRLPLVFVRLTCAVSSVVEHFLDTEGVTGSNPVSRTIFRYSPSRPFK